MLRAAQVGEREPGLHVIGIFLHASLELGQRRGGGRRARPCGRGAGLGGGRGGHEGSRAQLAYRCADGGPRDVRTGAGRIIRPAEEFVRLGEEIPVIARAAIACESRLERGDFRLHRPPRPG